MSGRRPSGCSAIVFLGRANAGAMTTVIRPLVGAQAALALLPCANLARRVDPGTLIARFAPCLTAVPAYDLRRGGLEDMVAAFAASSGDERSPTISTSRRLAAQVAIMVTRRCNMTCAHCSVESGPKIGGADPDEAGTPQWVAMAAAARVRTVRITGGEPMLRPAVVLRLVTECRRLGMASTMTTNGFWGRTPFQATKASPDAEARRPQHARRQLRHVPRGFSGSGAGPEHRAGGAPARHPAERDDGPKRR